MVSHIWVCTRYNIRTSRRKLPDLFSSVKSCMLLYSFKFVESISISVLVYLAYISSYRSVVRSYVSSFLLTVEVVISAAVVYLTSRIVIKRERFTSSMVRTYIVSQGFVVQRP